MFSGQSSGDEIWTLKPNKRRVAVFTTLVMLVSLVAPVPQPASAQLPETYEDLIVASGPVGYWRFEEQTCLAWDPEEPGDTSCRTEPTVGDIIGQVFPNVDLGEAAGLVDEGVAPLFFPSTDFLSGIYLDPDGPEQPPLEDFSLHVDPLTLELWVKTDADPGVPQALAGMDEPGEFDGGGYALELTSDGYARGVVVLEVSADPWQVAEVVVTGSEPINDGAAHHVALTKDANEVILYVDGVEVDAAASNGLPVAYQGCFCSSSDEAPFWVGRRLVAAETNPRTLEGVIDELAVYDRVLSPTEVAVHHNFEPLLFIARLFQGILSMFGWMGDPVNTVSGNFYQTNLDLDFPLAVFGMDWTRSYNSTETLATELGVAWTHAHGIRIAGIDGGGVVTMVLGDGRQIDFQPDGAGGFHQPMAFYGELVDNGDGTHTANMFKGDTWDFAVDGRLAAMSSWDGQTVTLTYGADGPTQIASGTGYTLTLDYDIEGRVDQVTSSDGRIVSYSYDATSRLASVTDTEGGVTAYTYNVEGLMESVTDPEGVVTVFNSYDTEGRVALQEFPGGQTSSFVYDPANLETTVTFQPSGEVFAHQYDAEGRIVGITDPLGNQVNMTRRADGELIGAVSRLGESLDQTFDDNGNVLTSATTTGGETTYTYDTENRLTSVTEPWGATTTYTYEGSERIPSQVIDELDNTTTMEVVDGLVTEVTDPDEVTTTFTYDTQRRLTSETNGADDTTSYDHDTAGRITSITTPLANVTTFTYDAEGRLLTSTDPTEATTTYTYDTAGRLLTITDPEGATTTHTYDTAGRLVTTTDSRSEVTTFAYDDLDQLTSTTRPGGATTSNSWSDLGRLLSTTDPLDRVSGFGYDDDGNQVTSTDPTGDATSTTRDSAGRIIAVTDPLDRTTSYDYDSFGRLVSTTDPTAATTTYEYDELGRTETVTDPRDGVTTTAYTPGGRAASVTDPNGDTTSYGYDPAGRVATITDPEGGVTEYTYDADGRVTSITSPEELAIATTTYDEAGRPLTVTDPAGVATTFTYNDRGDLVTTQRDGENPRSFDHDDRDLLSVTDPLGNTTSFDYDPRGNRTETTDALGRTVSATFADDDQTTSSSDALDRTTTVTYDDDGRIETVTDPSGREVTNDYDAAGQLTSQTFGGSAVVSYTYDDAGRRLSMTDPTGTTNYEYDPTGNLTEVTYPNGDTLNYVYDPAGRRTQMTYPNGSTVDYAYDDNSRLTSVTHSTGGTATYTYDDDGRLLTESLPDSTTRAYTYTNGQLTSYTQNGVTTNLTYDSSGRITETTGGEAWSFDYDPAGQLTAASGPSGSHSYTYDEVGNLVSKDGATLTVDDANQLTSTEPASADWPGFVDLPGTLGSYVEAPDNAALDITGDLDIRVLVEFDEPTVVNWEGIISKGNSGDLSYASWGFFKKVDGTNPSKAQFEWRTASGTRIARTSATGYIVAGPRWYRVTLDVNNGSGGHTVTFWYSNDSVGTDPASVSWTQHSQHTSSGTTSIRSSSSDVWIGDMPVQEDPLKGQVYYAEVRNGIGGTVVANPDFRDTDQLVSVDPDFSVWEDDYANTWTIYPVVSDPITGYVELTGTAGDFVAAPDAAALDITGDIDIRVLVEFAEPMVIQWEGIASKGNSGGQSTASWGFFKKLSSSDPSLAQFEWRTSSGTRLVRTSDTSYIHPGARWYRVTLDVNNGSGGHTVSFWYSDDPPETDPASVVWILKNQVITSGTTSVRASSADVWLGDMPSQGDPLNGRVFYAEIRNGIGGTVVANPDFRDTTQLTSTPPDYSEWEDDSANPWTVTGTGWEYVAGSDGAGYVYDSAGRLTELTEADGTVRTFEYDDRGLVTELTVTSPGGGTTTIDRVYDGDGLLAEVTVTHPDDEVDTYLLTWDRVLPVPQIVSVTVDGVETSLVYGTSRAFAVDAGGTESFEYSVLGDITAGPLTVAAGFDPYGQPETVDPGAVGFGYRGELHIGDLVYLRSRDLQPATGRFTTVDPIDGLPGTTTVANQYAYAGNDPIQLIDPLGLRPGDEELKLSAKPRGGQALSGSDWALRFVASYTRNWYDLLNVNEWVPQAIGSVGQLSFEAIFGSDTANLVLGYSPGQRLAEGTVDYYRGIISGSMAGDPEAAGDLWFEIVMVGAGIAGGSIVRGARAATYADDLARTTAEAGSAGQRIFRAVEPDELADLAGSGAFRVIPGQEGKYFFPTQQQAADFAEMMVKREMGGPFCVTSGCIPSGVLSQLERIPIAGEGPAYFIPEELLPYIEDLVIHG